MFFQVFLVFGVARSVKSMLGVYLLESAEFNFHIIMFFQVFLVFGVAGSVKSMPSGYSLDVEFNSASNDYPHDILLMYPATPKTRNTWKNMTMMFCQAFLVFGGSEVRQKYVVWVLIGCRIKFCIQWALPFGIWLKTHGYMLKIRTNKVVFSFFLQN